MHKFIKYLLIGLIGIPLLLVLLLGIFLQFKDANSFKNDIQEQAKSKAGLNVFIKGNLSWSLFPFGLDINNIELQDQQAQDFASADRILAQLSFFSLLSGAPQVHTVLLDGLNLELEEMAENEANWLNILPSQTKAQDGSAKQTNNSQELGPELQANDETDTVKSLTFLVNKLQVINANISLESKPKNLDIKLASLNIDITGIEAENDIPLSVSFIIDDTINQLTLKSNISSHLTFSSDFTEIGLKGFNSQNEITGGFNDEKTIHASLETELSLNTKLEKVNIQSLSASLENLTFDSSFDINSYRSQPNVTGRITLQPFSLVTLMQTLNLPLPEFAQEKSLNALSLQSSIELSDDLLRLDDIQLKVDDSQWLGQLAFNLQSQAITSTLEGDHFNLDAYLPKQSESKTAQSKPPQAQNAQSHANNEAPLLPLETLRKLNLDLKLKQDSLLANDIQVDNLQIAISAKNGLASLKYLKANTHEGKLELNATLDARTDRPLWQAKSNIETLNIGTLIQSLELQKADELGSLSGTLSLSADLTAKGNTLAELQTSALANTSFNISKGEVRGLNLKALSCEGIALINQETVSTRDWPLATPFDTLKGQASLKQQILSPRFDLSTSGLSIDASGDIDLAKNELDFGLGLKVTGNLGEQSCRVNDKVKDLVIPVRCKGKLDTAPKKLCGLDKDRLLEVTKQVAVKEGKRKLDKELDRALEKHLGDKQELKDATRNLFKKLF